MSDFSLATSSYHFFVSFNPQGVPGPPGVDGKDGDDGAQV